ncbi:hypothetical protein DP107_09510 [Haloglomus irregulare]|uniref:Uncharacterized protein n=1 Tax=Haloglomus irregulare TaxID=2234134 RepID=A0A554N8Y7_9EURY|nr:hypothetical protein DP107_09510 [Haloglomus irregulare]
MVSRIGNRGRVPFALVGVLLLVSSAAVHASLGGTPAAREPAAEAALEGAGASVVPALRVAVRRAARDAAADPVLTPANSSVGRALNGSQPFRDALRLRIYLAARAELAATATRERGVEARATLPPVEDAGTGTVRTAIERVGIRRAGPDGHRLRVQVEDVTLRARRADREVAAEGMTPAVTVETPVLALHDRTERYERRLDARTLSAEGAGARLTAGTYAIAQGRGTAQWAGAPISNVLGNGHLALATDAAVYDAQARTFGAMDPSWQEGLATSAGRAIETDVTNLAVGEAKRGGGAGRSVALDTVKGYLGDGGAARSAGEPFASEPVTVPIGPSADDAFGGLLDRRQSAERNLTDVLREAYTVDARIVAAVRSVGRTRTGERRPHEPGWELIDTDRQVDRRVEALRNDVEPGPPVPAGWHRLETAGRKVVEHETVVRRWRDGNRTTTTRRQVRTRYHVGIAVVGRHAEGLPGPDRPVRPVHEPGGALGGPNLDGVAESATSRLVDGRGGYEALARRATAGRLDTEPIAVGGDRPSELRSHVREDLTGLHRRARNLSVRTTRREAATEGGDTATALAAELRKQRRALVDPPRVYDGVADRARVAVRAAYLERVLTGLEARADRRDRARSRLNETLLERGLPSLDRIERLHSAARNATWSSPPADSGVRFVPDATPSRLALSPVERSRVGLRGGGEVRPLAARNTNLFTLPYSDVVPATVEGRESVPLPAAARTLRGAEHVPGEAVRVNDSFVDSRERLRTAVIAANDRFRGRAHDVLRRRRVADASERRAIVSRGLGRWPSPAARALALANGSAADAIAVEADRWDDGPPSAARRARLRTVLDREFRHTLDEDAGRVSREPVSEAASAARQLRDTAVGEAAGRAAETVADRAKGRVYDGAARTVPAGLPVLPPVAPWVATVNLWQVQARGVHPSLVVRARGRGVPGPAIAYERDGRPVRMDVDGDGEPERLGEATRVAFDIETAVLVVVPPGGRGVGDTNGDADERTGWPAPEPRPSVEPGGSRLGSRASPPARGGRDPPRLSGAPRRRKYVP